MYPAQYDASSKTLTYYSELELTVKTKEDGTPVNPFYRRRIHDFSVVGDIIDNPDMLDVYEYLGRNDRLRPFNDAEGGNMLIITTSELEQVEDQYNLSYLAEMHEKNKINKVFIRTVESIYDMYEFSGSEYISGGKNPWERDECYEIRECIKDYYSQKGVDYVLLVGDDDYQWQSNWVYPYLNAPLIRGYNIEDEQEVPTFQTYLYTIEAWAKRGGDDGCPDDDNGGGDDDDDDEDTPDDDNPDDDIPDDGTPDDGDIDPSPPDPDEGDPDSIIDGTSDDSGTDGNSDGPDSDDIDGEVPPESPDDPDTPGDDEGNDNDNNNNPPGKWECVYRKQITTASDLPYACLDNAGALDDILNYPDNYKGPKFFPDFLAEVYVGRAPVSNPDELKNFVKKTVSYMKSDKKDYHKVLMVGEYLGFGGPAQYAADALNELLNECDAHGYNTTGIPLAGSGQDASFKYSVEKLYEKYGSWTGSDLINTINGGNINIVNHLGHANVNFNMKLGTPGYNYYGACSVGRFDNEQYPIFYSQGCFAGAYDAGAPFYDDCIAEYMTVKNEHGGVAGIWNSHFGWGRFKSTDGPSQRYHREFIDAIYGEEISTLGMANQDSKEDNIDNVNCWPMLWLYYCINLIGDPALNVQGAPGYSPSGDLDDDDDDTDGDDDDEESSPIKDFIKKLLNGWPGKLLEFILFLLSKV